jgi:hypothetical protein
MTSSSAALYARYQPYRRWFEIGFWVFSTLQHTVINSTIALFDIRRAHLGFAAWQPVVWEASSSLLHLALVPAVIAFERRFPLVLSNWRRALPAHVLASAGYGASCGRATCA